MPSAAHQASTLNPFGRAVNPSQQSGDTDNQQARGAVARLCTRGTFYSACLLGAMLPMTGHAHDAMSIGLQATGAKAATVAPMARDAKGNVGYATAAECDAAISQGTAVFSKPPTHTARLACAPAKPAGAPDGSPTSRRPHRLQAVRKAMPPAPATKVSPTCATAGAWPRNWWAPGCLTPPIRL
jgi:hypothetical protein